MEVYETMNAKEEKSVEKEKKKYTITFPPAETRVLREYAEQEGVSMAETIRRALNFYQVRLKAKDENLDVVLEDKERKSKVLIVGP